MVLFWWMKDDSETFDVLVGSTPAREIRENLGLRVDEEEEEKKEPTPAPDQYQVAIGALSPV